MIQIALNYDLIMLTAKTEYMDKINGLPLGADDYIEKPFNPLELIARVKAQLRRYTKYNDGGKPQEDIIDFGGLLMNRSTHECIFNERELTLTPIEFDILWILCENRGQVISSEQLFEHYVETASISTNANRFSENVTGYDKNGNIKSLQRYGQTGASAYGLIDNLTFTLNGNQLSRVDDAVMASAYGGGFEFKDGVKQVGEYTYDANGNLTKDLNKGITDIQYNCLNLPSAVTFSDGSTITYVYAADGTKLRTVHKIGGLPVLNSAQLKPHY